MSTIDYKQGAEDHSALLLLVNQLGSNLHPKHYSRLYERVSKVTEVTIPNQQRSLQLRYDQNYSVENNEWGDFQAHRKILGLVCFAKCNNENEVAELKRLYEELKQQYNGTVFDSRLFIFGASSPLTNQSAGEAKSCDPSPTNEDKENSNVPPSSTNMKQNSGASSPAKTLTSVLSNGGTTTTKGANGNKDGNILYYQDPEHCPDLEDRMTDFAASLFWVLESKRLDRSHERLDKMPLLTTPFEKRDIIGVDTESRLYRKRCQGRLRKHLADLCLLASLPGEALLHYHTAADILRTANDWMWLAGALEGLCAASVIISAPKKAAGPTGFSRNQSFSVKRGSSAMKEAKTKPGSFSGPVQNGLDLAESQPKSLPDDVVDRYKEAIGHYSKFKNAGVVEMECSIKACRLLTTMQPHARSPKKQAPSSLSLPVLPPLYPSPMMPPMLPTTSVPHSSYPALPISYSSAAIKHQSSDCDDAPLDLSKKPSPPKPAVVSEDLMAKSDEPINLSAKPTVQKIKAEPSSSSASHHQMPAPSTPSNSSWYTQALSALATGQGAAPAAAAAVGGVSPGMMGMMMNPMMMNQAAAAMMNPAAAAMMMMNPAMMFGGAGAMPVASGTKESMEYYHKMLLGEFMEMLKKSDNTLVHKTQENYLKKWLDASEFLQNVVYINLPLSEDEKVQRYSTLSSLYADIGMHRKAAFFKRIAAMQCVSPTNPKPAWLKCYHLLLQALAGYKLSLNPMENKTDSLNGWPVVQLRVMHELIYSARRMGNAAIAVRHLMFLLHAMFWHLSVEERKEMAGVLETYSSRVEGSTSTLSIDNGILLPPVPFLLFPTVKSFKLVNPPPHLRPVKLKKSATMEDSGNPFIYSPIQFGNKKEKDSSVMDFKWIEGDVCEVELQVYNPLPFELKVTSMGLLTEGVEFESYPASLTLPAESGPFQVKMTGIAKESGNLRILGYHSLVMGCRSNCRLNNLDQISESQYEITVSPPLPQLGIVTSLPKASSFSNLEDSDSVVASAAVCVYAGQSCECTITLTNQSKVPIDVIAIDVESKLNKDFVHEVLVWQEENLQSQLPLAPGAQACITLYIHGVSTFLAPDKIHIPESTGMSRSGSSASGGQWASAVAEVTSTDPSGALVLDALLRLQYSGGDGLKANFCRHCCVAMNVEIQPAILVNKWDVISAQSVQHSRLVLDLENASSEELELSYSSETKVTLTPKHCQRVLLRLPKCNPHLPAKPRPPDEMNDSCEPTDTVRELITQHMANYVDIRWKIPSSNTEGHVSLDSLQWTDNHIALLTVNPVQWSVFVNDESQEDGVPLTILEGQTATVKCRISNNADCDISDVVLGMQCYQDCGSGVRSAVLGSKVMPLGAQRLKVNKIAGGKCQLHTCAFMFMSAGRYHVELAANGTLPSSSSSASTTTSTTSVSSSNPGSPHASPAAAAAAASTSTSTTSTSSVIETWTYIPAIVIDVQPSSSM